MDTKYNTLPKMRYQAEEVWLPAAEDILNWEKDFHDLMLHDQLRMRAYHAAIRAAVKPGMVVVDIGTGTGILSQWALEAGAKVVYGIDFNKNVLKVAQKRLKDLGYKDKFKPINDLSYNVVLSEKADIIISEIIGNIGDNEEMPAILADAVKRLLKKRGKILPVSVQTFLVPISSRRAHGQLVQKKVKSLNTKYKLQSLLSVLKVKNQFNLYYDTVLPEANYLSQPKKLQTFTFKGKDKFSYTAKLKFKVRQEGQFSGFKGYFVAKLYGKVYLDISGDDIQRRQASDSWKHCYVPIEAPIEVQKGDVIEVVFSRYYPHNKNSLFKKCYAWQGTVKRKRVVVGTFSQRMA